jgi:WD40 repeat protein
MRMSQSRQQMNPFPGLRPFTQEEDYLFFGREEQTLELLARLGSHRFVAVVGTSGSGKSSLVRCGLLSELLGGKMRDAGASWEIAVTHPGGNPLGLLTEALLDADLYDRAAENTRENLLATLSRSHFGLVEAVKQAGLGEGTNFLLVVDQFEEIFRFHETGQTQQEMANEFVSLLLEAAAQKEVPIYVVLTMRSDFIGECGQFEGLAEAVNRGEFLIPRLTREQYKRVIEGPIKVAGGQIAPRLLQRLLNDLGQQADQLPCLQHALMRTWNVWAEKGDQDALDLDDYQRVGKMTHALSLHADEIYDALATDRQRQLCRGLFQALTVQESENRGIRRPQRLGRLCQILDVPIEELLPIIDAYRHKGVTFLMPGQEVELTDRTIIDISHESLMRVWTRLRNWVEEEAQAAGIYLRLSESAALYEQGKAGLYRDPELGIALAWQESQHPNAAWAERYRPGFDAAMAFLTASQQTAVAEEQAREAARQRELAQAQELAESRKQRLDQQKRAAKRLRKMIAGLTAVAVIAGLACVVALVAQSEASRLAQVADEEAEKARHNEEKARQNAKRAERSRKETAKALATVESQKEAVEGSLSKAEKAERLARDAEEDSRKLLYTTDMRLAPFVWRDGLSTAQQLRVLLAKHIPDRKAVAAKKRDLRGFEWHYYQHLLKNSATVFSGHGVAVVDGAFTSDGQLVTLDENSQVRRWDLASQAEDKASRRDLPGGPSAQVRVLSPNGRLAALAEGNKVRVFDTSTGKEKFQIDSANNQYRRLTFSRDEGRLVIVDNKIWWLSTMTGEVIASALQKFERIESLAISADGLTLAVVGHANTGHQFSIFRLDATAKKVTSLAKDIGPGGTLLASALTRDGHRLAFGAKLSGSLFVYDTATGRPIAAHGSAHASPIAAMAFSGDGARLATADAEGTIKIWADAQKLTSKSAALLTLKGHQGAITTVGFSSDGKRLVTTSTDKTARVWDLQNAGAAIRPLERQGGSFVARFSPDGQLIAATGGKLQLFDAATGGLVRELPASGSGFISSVAFSPTDNRLLAVGYGGRANVSHVSLWDIDAGTELARLPGATDLPDFRAGANNGVVGALAFSPDGKYLVAGFGSKNMLTRAGPPSPLKVWEVATRRLIRRLGGHTGYCVSVAFSRDGKWLASGSRDGTAIIWSTATWNKAQTLQNPDKDSLYGGRGMVEDVAFSPSGKTLAMASREATVWLWDVATGKLLEPLKGHSSAVTAVVFSPDGRTLASGSGDQTVRLWNVETRRQLMQLDPGGVELGQVLTLAFSPNGMHLLAGGSSTAVWSAAPIVWNDPNLAAAKLRLLLRSKADFRRRIRMLSENLRLHEGLAKLNTKDRRVRAALAATQANWHASRQAWPEAVKAFDRLLAADPTKPDGWLRTPGLLRLATALVHQDRPRDAAVLLTGGARRREQDGVMAAVDRAGLGFVFSVGDGTVRVTQLPPGFPGSRAGLVTGDTIVKVNDTDLTLGSLGKISQLLAGEAGTKVRLTVRHSGSEKQEVIELTRERFVNDPATGELLDPLRATVNERLAKEPRNPGLLELRAELAGQWSGAKDQVADYTAAIAGLSRQKTKAAAVDLKRLYARRGNAHVALKQWQKAVDDYARVVTHATTDDALLSNQALAQAELLLASRRWTVLKPVEAKSELGSTLSILPDNSILARGANPLNDRYRVVLTVGTDIKLAAVRLEALTHDSLPGNGPGRYTGREAGNTFRGSFAQTSWKVTATLPSRKAPIALEFDRAWADHRNRSRVRSGLISPITSQGHWNISGAGEGQNCTAVWSLSKPVSLAAGTTLTFEMQFGGVGAENLGRFRLSVSSDPSAIDLEQKDFSVRKLTDPWQKLAAAYQLKGDQRAIDLLVKRRPKLAGPIGDLFTQGKDEDKDWRRALALYTKGITAKTTDAQLLSKRARAYEALKKWEAAAADWSRATSGNPDGAKLFAEFARRVAASGQGPLANGQFERAQALYERSLAADPANEVLATELAQLLLDKEATAVWTILTPREMKSEGGATLTWREDGSVLASGPNPEHDTYTLICPTSLQNILAVRLETLPDPSLPLGGPGRANGNGNVALSEWKVTAEPQKPSEGSRVIRWRDAWSDHRVEPAAHYNKRAMHIGLAIDGDLKTYWETWPKSGSPHCAVFLPNEPIGPEGGSKLKVVLEFRSEPRQHNLGCFRLSVSAGAAALDREQKRFAAMKPTDPWLRLAGAYAVNGRNHKALHYFSNALQGADGYEARKPILEFAARFDAVISALSKQHPDDPQLQLALARNLAERGKQHLATHQPVKAQAELEKARALFTRLLPTDSKRQWTVLTPVEMKAENGSKLELQKDGSIFVHDPAKNDTYTLVFSSELKGITGLRLEALADPRLPGGGPGWARGTTGWPGDGNFVLSELSLEAVLARGLPRSIALRNASADFSQQYWDVRAAVDGNSSTGWAVRPEFNKDHTAVFDTAEEVGDGKATRLRVRLSHQYTSEKYLLGRFRLSFTTEATTLAAARIRLDLKDREVADVRVALGKAYAQQSKTSEAVASFTEALPVATDRAARARIIAEAAPLEGVLEKLAKRAAGNALFQAELARHFAERGNAPLADAARAKARALFEKQLAKEPKNAALALELADVLLPRGDNWTVLTPVEMRAESGAKMEMQNDGSIFVHQKPPVKTDTYSLVFQTDLKGVRGLRLEVLPNSHLPNGGSGWAGDGNFVLNELTLQAASSGSPNKARAIALRNAVADFSQNDWHVRGAVDGIGNTGWAVSPETKKAHTAVFELAEQVGDGQAMRLTVRLKHQHYDPNYVLGRFRLSVSVDPATLEGERRRLTSMRITEPWARLAAAYHCIGDQPALARLLKRHPSAASGIGDVFAENQHWKRALAEYTRAITPRTRDARLFAARAEAYEKLEKWELAAADWGKADRYATDKKVRYGNPSFPALEHRAQIHGRLQQWDKQIQDYTELLKPERLGDNPWFFNGRGEAYDQLRQWDKALADFDQAVKVCQANERETFQFLRTRHFAAQGRWRQAADELRLLYHKPIDANKEWWRLRDASLIFALAGDEASYRKVAGECYRKESAQSLTVDDGKWTVLTMLLFSEMITKENRPHLLELAGKTDDYWRPRLTAAIHFRCGNDKKAAELFDANGGGPQFLFLAAMVQQKLGNHDRAKQLFEEGSSWIQQQRDNDPGCGSGVPRSVGWHDWCVCVQLQREAARKVIGPPLTKLDARLIKEPDNARALLERARLLARIGLMDEALADLGKLPKPKTNSSDYYGLRGRILAGLNRADEALADLNRAALSQSTDARVYAARGKILWRRGAIKPACKDLEKSLDMKPSAQTAKLLADLLLEASPSGWTVLKPTQMKSEGGATLTLQPDGSILASGKNPDRGAYTITARAELDRIRAIRLEALPDTSLPQNGPGRHPNGNFHLNGFRVFSGRTPAPLADVFATYHQSSDYQLRPIVGGKIDESCWSIYPQSGQRHTAFFAANFAHAMGDALKFEMYFSRGAYKNCDLGSFRLSVSGDPAILERERERIAARKITDSWAELAAAYHLSNDQPALGRLLKRHPAAAAGIGDVYAAAQDWERAIAEYRKAITDESADRDLLIKLATAYQGAGRTREALPLLVKASTADPKDTLLSLKLAALQAWFGQEKELAATRQRILAFAKGTSDAGTAEHAAKVCSIRPSTDKAELEAALAFGRKAVELGKGDQWREWRLLTLGMAEYRSGKYAPAGKTLRAAAKAGSNNPLVTGIAAFYRAMSLFRQGKPDEARKLASAAVAKMKPLPKDEQNPLANDAYYDDLILWLAYKEAKAMIKFEAAPPSKGKNDKK